MKSMPIALPSCYIHIVLGHLYGTYKSLPLLPLEQTCGYCCMPRTKAAHNKRVQSKPDQSETYVYTYIQYVYICIYIYIFTGTDCAAFSEWVSFQHLHMFPVTFDDYMIFLLFTRSWLQFLFSLGFCLCNAWTGQLQTRCIKINLHTQNRNAEQQRRRRRATTCPGAWVPQCLWPLYCCCCSSCCLGSIQKPRRFTCNSTVLWLYHLYTTYMDTCTHTNMHICMYYT